MLPTPQRAGAFSTVLSALWVRSAFLADRLIWPSLTPGNTIAQAMLTSWAASAVPWLTSPSIDQPLLPSPDFNHPLNQITMACKLTSNPAVAFRLAVGTVIRRLSNCGAATMTLPSRMVLSLWPWQILVGKATSSASSSVYRQKLLRVMSPETATPLIT